MLVVYEDLEKRRRENGALFIMDYNTPLEACDLVAKLFVLTETELRTRRKSVLNYWKKDADWAEPWPSNSRVAVKPVVVRLVEQKMNVQLTARRA